MKLLISFTKRFAIAIPIYLALSGAFLITPAFANEQNSKSGESERGTTLVTQGALHQKDWFETTFRDVADDIIEASDAGKRIAILFEQYGCGYCTRMHKDHLEDAAIKDYLQKHYQIVQYNLFGSEEVTDIDGEVLTEKLVAEKWGVMFTPTFIFLPTAEELKTAADDATVADIAVAALPGLPGKSTFRHMFMWVAENGYSKDEHFQKYHARLLKEGL